ncbi:DALR domain-containing protein, partial [Methylophilus sp.]
DVPNTDQVPTIDIDWQQAQAARFKAAMDDDFNTAEALAVLFELANDLNKDRSQHTAALLKQLAGIVGLLQRDPQAFMQGDIQGDDATGELDIDSLITARISAKKAKDFAEADRIRKALSDAGIVLEDTAQGTTWRRA